MMVTSGSGAPNTASIFTRSPSHATEPLRGSKLGLMQTPPVIEKLVATCQAALDSDSPHQTIHAAMVELFADPTALAAQIPHFTDDDVDTSPRGFRLGGEHIAHQTDDLTVMVLDTLPGVLQPPHDHSMNVVIGVFEGTEEQRFWARTDDGVAPAAGRSLETGDVIPLGARAIHAISAPAGQAARAIHVYLGNIYDVERSLFDPTTLEEHPFTGERYDEYCQANA